MPPRGRWMVGNSPWFHVVPFILSGLCFLAFGCSVETYRSRMSRHGRRNNKQMEAMQQDGMGGAKESIGLPSRPHSSPID